MGAEATRIYCSIGSRREITPRSTVTVAFVARDYLIALSLSEFVRCGMSGAACLRLPFRWLEPMSRWIKRPMIGVLKRFIQRRLPIRLVQVIGAYDNRWNLVIAVECLPWLQVVLPGPVTWNLGQAGGIPVGKFWAETLLEILFFREFVDAEPDLEICLPSCRHMRAEVWQTSLVKLLSNMPNNVWLLISSKARIRDAVGPEICVPYNLCPMSHRQYKGRA